MPIYVSDDIVLKDNTISTAQSNANVQIIPNGAGALTIDSVDIKGNRIETNESNATLELSANSSGYVRVMGTGAFGVPATPAVLCAVVPAGTPNAPVPNTLT